MKPTIKITMTSNDFKVMQLLYELEDMRDALEQQTKVFKTYIKDSSNLLTLCVEQLSAVLERVDDLEHRLSDYE